MTAAKSLGIWMDHSSAHLMEFSNDSIETNIIESKNMQGDKEHDMSRGEKMMHNRQQQQDSDYYKKLAEAIRNYESVILFGPTDAKAELHNILKADHHFDDIKIEVKQADKMTENQEHAFVKEHFAKH